MALWVTNIEDDFRVINMDAIVCVKKSKTNKNCWDVFLDSNVSVELTHKEMLSLYKLAQVLGMISPKRSTTTVSIPVAIPTIRSQPTA